jgi:CRP-like cAMP-binding protein
MPVSGDHERFTGRRPTVEELRGIGLFGGIDDDVLHTLCAAIAVETVDAGRVVVDENDRGGTLWVVLEGELEMTKSASNGERIRIGTQEAGSWFGAMSMIDMMPSPARVQALAPSVLMRMRASDLNQLYRSNLKAYALLVMNIARQLSRELRSAQELAIDTRASARRRPD